MTPPDGGCPRLGPGGSSQWLRVWDGVEFHEPAWSGILGLSTVPTCHKGVQFHSNDPGDLLRKDKNTQPLRLLGDTGTQTIITQPQLLCEQAISKGSEEEILGSDPPGA